MANYNTVIDSISLQIDCLDKDRQAVIIEVLKAWIISSRKVSIQFDNDIKKYRLYYERKTVATISTGYSKQLYYIRVRVSGLKRYKQNLDNASYNCLMLVCSYLNTANINFRLVELDIAIDSFCSFEHILAVCTKKSPNVIYNSIGSVQYFNYSPTSYIENYRDSNAKKNAVLRSYVYAKNLKESLSFPVTRFEVKLQSRYFNSFGFNTQTILDAMSRYHVMYFADLAQKEKLIYALNNNPMSLKLVNDLGLDKFRLQPNGQAIVNFMRQIQSVYVDFEGSIAFK